MRIRPITRGSGKKTNLQPNTDKTSMANTPTMSRTSAIMPPGQHNFNLTVMLTKKTAPLYANTSIKEEDLDQYKADSVYRINLALKSKNLQEARSIAIEYHATILLLGKQNDTNYCWNSFYPITTGLAFGKDFVQIIFNSSKDVFPPAKTEENSNKDNEPEMFSTKEQSNLIRSLGLTSQKIGQLLWQEPISASDIMHYEEYLSGETANDKEYEDYYAARDIYNKPDTPPTQRAQAGKEILLMALKHKQENIKAEIRKEFKEIIKKHKKEIDHHFDQNNQDLLFSIDGTVYCIERQEKDNNYIYLLKVGDSLEEVAQLSFLR